MSTQQDSYLVGSVVETEDTSNPPPAIAEKKSMARETKQEGDSGSSETQQSPPNGPSTTTIDAGAFVPTATLRGRLPIASISLPGGVGTLYDAGVPIKDAEGVAIDSRKELAIHWKLATKQPFWGKVMIWSSYRRDYLRYPLRQLELGKLDWKSWGWFYSPSVLQSLGFLCGVPAILSYLFVAESSTLRNSLVIIIPIFWTFFWTVYVRVTLTQFARPLDFCESFCPHFHGVREARYYAGKLYGTLDTAIRLLAVAVSNSLLIIGLINDELQFKIVACFVTVIFLGIGPTITLITDKSRVLVEFYCTELLQQGDRIFGQPTDTSCIFRDPDPEEQWFLDADEKSDKEHSRKEA